MRKILEKLKTGELSIEEAEQILKKGYFTIENFLKFDVFRELRHGIPEVIIAEGKTLSQLVTTLKKLKEIKEHIIVTRLDRNIYRKLRTTIPRLRYYKEAEIAIFGHTDKKFKDLTVAILTGGTTDIKYAEECRLILEEFGVNVLSGYDIGVAGLHRIIDFLKENITKKIRIYIIFAGREAALPTLVAGLVDAPVIGVPVKSGYGYQADGSAALGTMLQSCIPIAVVNINSGFSAAIVALQILRQLKIEN